MSAGKDSKDQKIKAKVNAIMSLIRGLKAMLPDNLKEHCDYALDILLTLKNKI